MEKEYKYKRIASMSEDDIAEERARLEAELRETDSEIERVLSELAGQTGLSALRRPPKMGQKY